MNVRLSILLAALFLIIGGSVIVSRLLSTPESRLQEPKIWSVAMEDIVHISATHGEETVSYARNGDQWVIEDGNDTPVYIDKWAGTTLLLSGPRAARVISQTVSNLADYGLDKPSAIIVVQERGGQSFEFHLGIKTPDERNQYATLVGNPRLFTLASEWGDVVTGLATEPPYPPEEGEQEESASAG